ncbi:low molecular weight phosphatase family protein [Ruania halotolerans]|uniref:arsenate reductase/protein-tyrosine-phosphatase family protein n=1 Tax=Ruania halotolerans TaxID=2897773 RepID=UPI001E39799C|nr:low molecular weight phosphatase family protein [Ruania halotolerans]UFU07258.1 low molecular weight phosphatase family protein [Ruania halotolerans]
MSTPAFPPYRILAVCTGNVCRSPAAERLLTVHLDSSVEVTSAGTHALVGEPISPPMDILLAEAGADAERFSARQLSESTVRGADLILALTREHRAAVVDLWPGAVRRTFTLTEFARALEAIDASALPERGSAAERLTAASPLAGALRGQRPPSSPTEDDIVDPYRRERAIYQRSFDQIHRAVTAIADAVRES